jgi:hypothetical protein
MRFSILTLLMLTFLVAIYFGLSTRIPWAALMVIPPVMAALSTTFACLRWPSAKWSWLAMTGTLAAMLVSIVWMIELLFVLIARSLLDWYDGHVPALAVLFIALNTFNGLLVAMSVAGVHTGIRRWHSWRRRTSAGST